MQPDPWRVCSELCEWLADVEADMANDAVRKELRTDSKEEA